MPDYSLCRQAECPKAAQCCRFLGVAGYHQSYFQPKFTREGCDFFWDVKHGAPFKLMLDRLTRKKKVRPIAETHVRNHGLPYKEEE